MGIFRKMIDAMMSIKRPEPGTPVLPAEEVKKAVLAANRETAPYQIRDGKAEGVDLIAEWKIVDAKWYEIFAKAGKKDTFKIEMTLDPEKNEVRAVDKRFTVEWKAGIPTISASVKAFKGQQQSVEFGTAYAFTEELRPGEVYNYRFSTKELKTPIQDAVTKAGWVYRGVVKA